jgi:hypothetical protein
MHRAATDRIVSVARGGTSSGVGGAPRSFASRRIAYGDRARGVAR